MKNESVQSTNDQSRLECISASCNGFITCVMHPRRLEWIRTSRNGFEQVTMQLHYLEWIRAAWNVSAPPEWILPSVIEEPVDLFLDLHQ